jgi:hypothetical protein
VLFLAGVTLALQACVYSPQVVESYRPECPEPRKRMEIRKDDFGEWMDCHGGDCLSYGVAAGFVSAGSFVVTTTVAAASNVAYWAEYELACD